MLKIMFKLSLVDENVDLYRPEMQLRTGPKVKMKIPFTDKERVKRSPLYLCNKLWEKLDSETQHLNNVIDFTNKLKNVNLMAL